MQWQFGGSGNPGFSFNKKIEKVNAMKNCRVGGKGIIVALDVADMHDLRLLLSAIKDVPGITGVKVGFLLAMQDLSKVVKMIRVYLGDDVDIIYDHQKAGNDIPDMGAPFARCLGKAGVDSAILFPFTGPATQSAWMKACIDTGLEFLVGGIMTHPKFLASEGGYIDDEAVLRIYDLACVSGCRHFVVPGTKIEWVRIIREFLENKIGSGTFSLYAPGLITQGGDISECGKVAGNSFFPIVGRAIYEHIGIKEQRTAATTIAGNFLTQINDREVRDEQEK